MRGVRRSSTTDPVLSPPGTQPVGEHHQPDQQVTPQHLEQSPQGISGRVQFRKSISDPFYFLKFSYYSIPDFLEVRTRIVDTIYRYGELNKLTIV